MSKVTEALELHQRWIEERRKADQTDSELRKTVSELDQKEKDIFWHQVELNKGYPNDK